MNMAYISRPEGFGLGELSMEQEVIGQNFLVKKQLHLAQRNFGPL
jgi:hypothetical protein